MTRFENLEFGTTQPTSGVGGKKPAGATLRDAGYFYKKAVRSYLAGSFENALREYSRSLETDPAFIKSWFGQIRMLIELKEYPEAVVWSDKALESFPENAGLYALKALACLRNGEQSKATALSDMSVSKSDPSSLVWLVRAEVLGRKRNVSHSCLGKAISGARGEEIPLVMLNAGRSLIEGELYTDALKHLKKAVATAYLQKPQDTSVPSKIAFFSVPAEL